ncbi:hypothetical protein DVH05_028622 [Phytophthora capsici]|nr:hypothetical protein DVH05_028622 [Phytophthora capsici]
METFREWIRQLNRDMRAAERNILLLVDNASSHKTSELTLSNVNVQFLPPNTTAFLQPMDTGIIATFKKMYRKKQLKWVYDKINSGEPIEEDAYDVDQLQAMRVTRSGARCRRQLSSRAASATRALFSEV